MKTISVVIPTFNRAEMACRCVKSVLAADTAGCKIETIVVDDCSPDATSELIAAECGGAVKILRNEKNSFQAVSRNRGAAAATGDWLLFLDDDNILEKNVFAELLKAFAAKPRAGLIAPVAVHRTRGEGGLVWSLGSGFGRWTSMPRDFMAGVPEKDIPRDRTLFPTTYYPNGFMVTRAAFAAAGGFDESYEQIFEESDFGWKIMEAGFEEYVCATAVTNHYGFLEPGCTPELRRLGIEKPYRTYCFARNRLRFARKHFNLPQVLSVSLVFAPLSAVYYCGKALAHRRPDIALAYLKGTVAGILGL